MAGRYETYYFVVLARQATRAGEIDSSESIPRLHKHLQIRAQVRQIELLFWPARLEIDS